MIQWLSEWSTLSAHSKARMPETGAPPLVTILICVYNGAKYLAATLDSALVQTWNDFEIVVVDDGSTDQSLTLLDRYSEDRLRVIRQQNQGPASALHTGLQSARGKFIALLDQDDLWMPGSLAAHIELLTRQPALALTFSWFRVIDAEGRELSIHSSRHRGTIDFGGLLTDFVIGATSNVVIRRAAIDQAGGIDTNFPRMYDMDLFLRIALLAPENIEAIPRDLMRYRRHAGQVSRDIEGLRKEWERLFEKMRGLAPREVARVERGARSNMSRYFARLAYEDGLYTAALTLLTGGFRYAPAVFAADGRNWTTLAACFSGLVLPPRLHRGLESLAGVRK